MKAINIQRRRLMTSLALSALAAAPGASWAQTAAKALASARGARIVVVGAGVGGATAAKYLKLFNKNLDVTLIDRNPNFIRHYGSSELITGAVTMEDLTVSYDALSDRYGVCVVRDTIVGLDADRRTVIGEKGRYAYDKLIVSPGIELLYEGIPGYSAELAATKIPSGWIAGPQTQLLADQLKAMPQGGTFCLVAPPNPYRCPPGPYERAALVTEWCAKHNPTAKIIVTDPKNNFVTDETMLLGWNRLYGFSIPADYKARLDKYASPARPDCRLEWVQEKQGGRPLAIDASAMTVTTDHVALEHLDTLTVTLGDAIVNLDVVANVEFGEIGLDLLLLDCANDIHCLFLLICSVKPLLVTRHDWTVYRHCPYRASYLVR